MHDRIQTHIYNTWMHIHTHRRTLTAHINAHIHSAKFEFSSEYAQYEVAFEVQS